MFWRSNRDDTSSSTQHRLFFAPVSAAATQLATEVAITPTHPAAGCCTGLDHQAVVYNGSEYGIAHPAPDGTMAFTRMSGARQVLGTTNQISASTMRNARVAWTGTEWVLAWWQGGVGHGMRMRRVSTAGAAVGTELVVEDLSPSSMIATSDGLIVAWSDTPDGTNYDVWLRRFVVCP